VSFLLAFLGFAALIILHELGHFTAAKAVGMRVERFSLFFPPLAFRKKWGETEYAIGLVPLGGYVKISGQNPHEELPPEIAHRGYFRQPVWKRVVVIAAGPAVNIALAFLILMALIWSEGISSPTTEIEQVTAPPARGVLAAGDRLVAVDGVRGDFAKLKQQIASHECPGGDTTDGCKAATPATITLARNGEERTVKLRPVYDAAQNDMLVGFAVGRTPPAAIGPGRAAGESVSEMWYFTTKTVDTIANIFNAQDRKQISGVVGSYEATRQTIEISIQRAVYLLAIISLSLGVINLFPFLPLDGGHIFWALAEKVRGRAIPFSVMERAGFVGFVLVIALFMIGFTNDVGRLTGEGFGVR
jgi:regulator of sigma E protease